MKVSHASACALTSMARLARQRPDRSVPSHEVARELDLPERFLLKVLMPLAAVGFCAYGALKPR